MLQTTLPADGLKTSIGEQLLSDGHSIKLYLVGVRIMNLKFRSKADYHLDVSSLLVET